MPWEWSDSEKALYFMGEKLTPEIRSLEDMRPVLHDPSATGPEEAYYMYRSVHLPEHTALMEEHNVRYDITVIPPAVYGVEFTKTKGHFHPLKGEHTYTEIYEVIEGEAHYLFQDQEKVLVYRADKGDKVIVPPDFGHVTINPSNKTLVMSNFVSPEFSADYGPFVEKQGAAYYELTTGWVENPHYTGFSMAFAEPGEQNCPFYTKQKTMYEMFCEEPKLFSFLNNPGFYAKQ
ncbi:MAG: glucose-6-phosphate isomerase [Candidatus Diapherotrites archaeon]|nr:glucose-6-phosphate isomerase [Candidatus Diapherotrites archaeon]